MTASPDAFSTPLLSLLLIEAAAITATRAALFSKTIRHALLWTFGIIFLILFIPYATGKILYWDYTGCLAAILVLWTFTCGIGTWLHIQRLWRHDE